jgi:hypothetical protein
MDIFDTGLVIDFTRAATHSTSTYNGFLLTDTLSAIPDFTTLSYSLDTNMVGLSLSNLYRTPENFGFNWNGLSFTADTYVNLDVSVSAVPAAVWLFDTALMGLVGFGRRRKAA